MAHRKISIKKQAGIRKCHTSIESMVLKAAREWERAFDAIKSGVLILDKSGKILKCNKAVSDITGKPINSLLGRPCHNVIHGTLKRVENCPFSKAKRSLSQCSSIIPRGNKRFLITVDPIVSKGGELAGAVHMMNDVSSHSELQKKQDAADFYGSSEDIIRETMDRLLIVCGCAELSLMGDIKDSRVRKNLATILKESQNAKDLLGRIQKK